METKITIIMPIYNSENYLVQALDSVLTQSLKELQLICVDDDSTDNSKKILDEYRAKDERILVIHKKNEGQGIARNIALEKAIGKYVLFMDSDDWLEEDSLEKMYSKLEQTNAEVLVFNGYKYYEKTKKKDFYNFIAPYQNILKNEIFGAKDLKENIYKINALAFKIYKKSALIRYNFHYSNHRRLEDHLPFFTFFAQAKSITILDVPVLNYRVNETSATFTVSEHLDDFFGSFYDCYNALEEKAETKEFLSYFLNHRIKTFFYYQNLIAKKSKKKYYDKLRQVFKYISQNSPKYLKEDEYFSKIQMIIKMPYLFYNFFDKLSKTIILFKTHI